MTLSQAQFDMLCNKLHGLENSIAEMRSEISRNSQGLAGNDSDASKTYAANGAQTNGDVHANGHTIEDDGKAPQVFQRHAAMHGIHAKNDQVGACMSMKLRHDLAD